MFAYVHLPFCRRKCTYCKFAIGTNHSPEKIREYLGYIDREIRGFFSGVSGEMLEGLYFGGGTPSVLSSSDIGGLIILFREHIRFATSIEITIECHPEDINQEYLKNLSDSGVNRVSLGVETLCDSSLATIGRPESVITRRALDCLSASVIPRISVDLIIGLPQVREGQIVADVETIISGSRVDHASVYLLETGRYGPEYTTTSLDDTAKIREYHAVADVLAVQGFARYEVSNFARDGHASRHNNAYWNHSRMRGFGLAASSYDDGRRFTNARSFAGYYRGDYAENETLTPDQHRLERLLFGLRTIQGVDERDIGDRRALTRYIDSGWLVRRDGRIFSTSACIFALDFVIAELV